MQGLAGKYDIPDEQIRDYTAAFKKGGQLRLGTLLEDGTVLQDPEEIEKRFRGRIEIVISGECPGEPSSIIDLTGDEPVLIRRGRGDLSWLE